MVKNPSTKAGVKGYVSWEDPLEEEMETHATFLVWKIPWTEELGGLWSLRSQRGEPQRVQSNSL